MIIIMGVDNGIDIVEVTTGGASNAYSGDLVIPETVTWQGTTYTVVGTNAGAFTNCTNLTSLTLPATTRRCIDSFVDNECTSLTAITCLAITPPTNLTGITAEQYANIVVTVPKNSVAAYQADENWGQFANIQGMAYDFKRGDFFYEITDDNQVAIIRENSTSYQNLTEANIPASVTLADVTYSVTAIGNRTFYQRTNLQSVTFPSSLKSIGDYAFYKCTGLTGSLQLNEGLESIGTYAFAYCTMTSVIFPYSVTNIGDGPFAFCTSLTQFQRRSGQHISPTYTVQNGVVFRTRFEAIYTLAIFPGGKAQIYTVPDGTVAIGAHAFRGSIVRAVNMPTSLRSISESAFANCESLTSIEVPKGVTAIGESAFSNCTALTAVILPSTLQTLGGRAFYNDGALVGVSCKATTPPTCQIITVGTNNFAPFDASHFQNTRLRVPTGCKNAYMAAPIWKLFNSIVESSSLDEVTMGDVDGDGNVGIADVTALVDYILDHSNVIVADAADVDQDGNIGIADVTVLIDYILNGTW